MDESLNGALVELVKALGGSKQVGPLLWPADDPGTAQRKLLDCLNPERPHHLRPEQVLFLLRLGRQRGVHGVMAWICHEAGYAPPVAVEPRDEMAELQRQFLEAAAGLQGLGQRLERMQQAQLLSSAVGGIRRAA